MARFTKWAAGAAAAGLALAIAPAASADLTLLPAERIELGSPATGIAGGDLNGDGRTDLVAFTEAGAQTFLSAAGPPIATPRAANTVQTRDPAILDVTGDGRADLFGDGTVLPGDGAGGFTAASPFAGTTSGRSRLADVDGDGRLDHLTLAVTSPPGTTPPTSSVTVAFGRGGTGVVAEFPGAGPDFALGDLNNDGTLDMVRLIDRSDLPNPLPRSIAVLLNSSATGFGAPALLNAGIGTVVISQPATPLSVAIGDLNGDGRADVVIGDATGRVSVRLGDGVGGLGDPEHFLAGPRASDLRIADMNGDGRPDIVVASGSQLAIMRGNGRGRLGIPDLYDIGDNLMRPVIADLDGDGDLDVASVDSGLRGGVGATPLPLPSVMMILRSATRLGVSAARVRLEGTAGSTIRVPLNLTVPARTTFRLLGAGRVVRSGVTALGGTVVTLPLPGRRGRYTLALEAVAQDGQRSTDRALIVVTGGRR